MAHPNESMLRAAYEAFAKGDLETVMASFADDIVFHIPGRNQVTGDYRRKDGFQGMIGKVMELSGGTFQEELHDALANDEHGVALARHRLERGGRRFEYTTVHVWHVRDGRLAEFWEHPGDEHIFDEAWA